MAATVSPLLPLTLMSICDKLEINNMTHMGYYYMQLGDKYEMNEADYPFNLDSALNLYRNCMCYSKRTINFLKAS